MCFIAKGFGSWVGLDRPEFRSGFRFHFLGFWVCALLFTIAIVAYTAVEVTLPAANSSCNFLQKSATPRLSLSIISGDVLRIHRWRTRHLQRAVSCWLLLLCWPTDDGQETQRALHVACCMAETTERGREREINGEGEESSQRS